MMAAIQIIASDVAVTMGGAEVTALPPVIGCDKAAEIHPHRYGPDRFVRKIHTR